MPAAQLLQHSTPCTCALNPRSMGTLTSCPTTILEAAVKSTKAPASGPEGTNVALGTSAAHRRCFCCPMNVERLVWHEEWLKENSLGVEGDAAMGLARSCREDPALRPRATVIGASLFLVPTSVHLKWAGSSFEDVSCRGQNWLESPPGLARPSAMGMCTHSAPHCLRIRQPKFSSHCFLHVPQAAEQATPCIRIQFF